MANIDVNTFLDYYSPHNYFMLRLAEKDGAIDHYKVTYEVHQEIAHPYSFEKTVQKDIWTGYGNVRIMNYPVRETGVKYSDDVQKGEILVDTVDQVVAACKIIHEFGSKDKNKSSVIAVLKGVSGNGATVMLNGKFFRCSVREASRVIARLYLCGKKSWYIPLLYEMKPWRNELDFGDDDNIYRPIKRTKFEDHDHYLTYSPKLASEEDVLNNRSKSSHDYLLGRALYITYVTTGSEVYRKVAVEFNYPDAMVDQAWETIFKSDGTMAPPSDERDHAAEMLREAAEMKSDYAMFHYLVYLYVNDESDKAKKYASTLYRHGHGVCTNLDFMIDFVSTKSFTGGQLMEVGRTIRPVPSQFFLAIAQWLEIRNSTPIVTKAVYEEASLRGNTVAKEWLERLASDPKLEKKFSKKKKHFWSRGVLDAPVSEITAVWPECIRGEPLADPHQDLADDHGSGRRQAQCGDGDDEQYAIGLHGFSRGDMR